LPGILALIIVMGPILGFFYSSYRYFNKKKIKYLAGLRGESVIYFELKKLPKEYSVFQDVKIYKRCNIDFVVLGPTGIFAIEVKSHSGKIDFNGRDFLINGTVFKEKNILNQAYAEASKVKEIIRDVENVYPVLAFSHYNAIVSFGFKPQNNVYVINKKYLNNFIKQQAVIFDDNKIFNIKSVLLAFVAKPANKDGGEVDVNFMKSK
jgi:hypothetical protein